MDKVGFDGSGEKDEDIIGGMEDVCCMDGAFDKVVTRLLLIVCWIQ